MSVPAAPDQPDFHDDAFSMLALCDMADGVTILIHQQVVVGGPVGASALAEHRTPEGRGHILHSPPKNSTTQTRSPLGTEYSVLGTRFPPSHGRLTSLLHRV